MPPATRIFLGLIIATLGVVGSAFAIYIGYLTWQDARLEKFCANIEKDRIVLPAPSFMTHYSVQNEVGVTHVYSFPVPAFWGSECRVEVNSDALVTNTKYFWD